MEDQMLSHLSFMFGKSSLMEDTPRLALFRLSLLAASMMIFDKSNWVLLFVAFAIYRFLTSDFGRRIRQTFKRDISGLFLLIRVKIKIHRRLKQDRPLHEIFLERVREHPEKEAAVEIETGKRLNYRELNNLMNQYANYFRDIGYQKGDVVALFMENNIDFFALWLGLSKIGVVSAFINSNLKLEPLSHSIKVSKGKAVITTTSLLPTFRKAQDAGLLDKDLDVFVNDDPEGKATEKVLSREVASVSKDEPAPTPGLNFQSVLCYIYTSGTTGNPKPAVIKHFRYFWMAMGSAEAFGIRHEDRVYITMPVYHSAAGVLGIGSMIVRGTTVVIRKKFSATNFWKDAVTYDCTCSQYIGELCRYLLASKPVPEEKQHRIRLMWGNGLRAEIWREFTGRFGIEKIGELYGSTEGNSNILNIDNHVGSCGFFPIYPHISGLYPVRLVRVDEETGELLRGKNGLAVPCRPGETGEMVGLIKNKDILLRFDGYVEKGDTAKKIYTDVLQKGDQVFASGDILFWDELGYLFFKDRRGDTFRWKGENVSTTEVEGILQPVKSIIDCTVYGVEIGKLDGRAGMAALQLADEANIEELLREASERYTANLAGYAIPVFIRICSNEVERTGTYKLKKTDLQKAGYNLERCKGDAIFFYDVTKKSYIPLTLELQQQIDDGTYTRI